MLTEIFFAIVQAITEFLPISSSGHLALFSNIISQPNLFFFTALHLASLLAVIIFLRKEVYQLITFQEKSKKLWLFLIIATIPAAAAGYFFNNLIEKSFVSLLFLSIAFFITGIILFSTKYIKITNQKLNIKNSFIIGLFQILALFPGISRSGTTISAALFQNIEKEKAIKFSFLLFIPLSLGAFLFETAKTSFYINNALIISFIICTILSLIFLNILTKIVKSGNFWMFSFYCWLIAIISAILYLLI